MGAILELLIIGVLFLVGTIVINTLYVLDRIRYYFYEFVRYVKNKFEKNKNL